MGTAPVWPDRSQTGALRCQDLGAEASPDGGLTCQKELTAYEMADWFYTVQLARTKDLARLAAEHLLVQLVCENHLNARFQESDRETSACEIAGDYTRRHYGADIAAIIGYRKASRYGGDIPMNLGEASFTSPCG